MSEKKLKKKGKNFNYRNFYTVVSNEVQFEVKKMLVNTFIGVK